jgi:hypothetical protein
MTGKYGLWLYIQYDDEPIPTSLVVMEDPTYRQWSGWWQRPILAAIPYQGIWWPGHNLAANADSSYYYPQGADTKPDKDDALFMLDGFLPMGLQPYSAGHRSNGRFIKPPFSVANTEFEWSIYLHYNYPQGGCGCSR